MSEKTVKFLSTTVGRDRINRFVQYFSRYVAWALERQGADKELVAKLTKLQAAIGMTRKVMRTGRQIEFYRTIVKSSAVKDQVVRYTTVMKNVFLSLWLAHDTLQWLHTAGVFKFDSIKDIGIRSNKFWLYALIFSVIGDLHKLRINSLRLGIEEKALRREKDEGAEKTVKLLRVERQRIVLATLQDSIDLLLPSSGLEYVKIETGWVGLAGAITSLIGGFTHWMSL